MTGFELSGARQRAPEPPIRVRVPASRGGLAWLAVLVVIGAFLAVQLGRQVFATWSMGQERAALEAQIASMEERNAALQRELDYLTSDAFVSAEARRLLNIGKPGEQVLIIPPGSAATLPPAAEALGAAPDPFVRQWLELFFGP